MNVQEVAEQLGVRYVLEGSVQKSGEKLRVTAQLVDAVNGKHIWAERYDRKLDDLFAMQDEITNKIFYEMHVKLTIGERAYNWQKHFGDPEGMRLHMKGFDRFLTFTLDGHQDAERIYGELYKKKPEGGMGNLDMGWIHWQKIVMRLSNDPKQSIKLGRKFGEKAHAIMEMGDLLHCLHGLICLNKISSPQLKMLVVPLRSVHQMGIQQLLLEPFIGILESLRNQPLF